MKHIFIIAGMDGYVREHFVDDLAKHFATGIPYQVKLQMLTVNKYTQQAEFYKNAYDTAFTCALVNMFPDTTDFTLRMKETDDVEISKLYITTSLYEELPDMSWRRCLLDKNNESSVINSEIKACAEPLIEEQKLAWQTHMNSVNALFDERVNAILTEREKACS